MKLLYSPQSRAERLIAAGRVVLAASSLFAIWFDPSEPAKHASIAYSLLIAYVVYSLGIAALVWRSDTPSDRQRWVTQAVDLAFFSLMMYFAVGTANPFIAYFVFSVTCATLRWQWRGTLWTAVISLGCFLGVGLWFAEVVDDPAFEIYPLVVRSVYLIVIAVLLGYLGVHEERIRREMARLAAWPREPPGDEIRPLVRELLEHAARALGARRVVLAWFEREEPWLYRATWSASAAGELAWERTSPGEAGELVAPPLRGTSFLCSDAGAPSPAVLRRVPGSGPGLERWRGAPLDAAFRERFGIRSVLALNVAGDSLEGLLFALDRPDLTSDDLVLGEIVAGLLASRLDLFYMAQRLREAAATEERIRLSRDLHDGVLQSLTGIGLRLAAVRGLLDGSSPAARSALEAVQRLITLEQRDLRFFIQELKPPPLRPPGSGEDLTSRVAELVQRMELEWGVRAELRAETLNGAVPESLGREVYHLVREALVNAARHGEASAVRVEIARPDARRLSLSVSDNGRGFPFEGRFSHRELHEGNLGPRNLMERVESLRGTLALETGPAGARLDIALPLEPGVEPGTGA